MLCYAAFTTCALLGLLIANRVTRVACCITLRGHCDKPSSSLAAAYGSINFGAEWHDEAGGSKTFCLSAFLEGVRVGRNLNATPP